MNFHKIMFLNCFLFLINGLQSQDINMLDEKNGFRGIKLSSQIADYDFFIKRTPSNSHFRIIEKFVNSTLVDFYGSYTTTSDYYCDNCESYIMIDNNNNYTSVPGSEILKLGVNTYKGNIYEINFYIKANNGSDYTILRFCEAYGYPNGWNWGWSVSEFEETEKKDGQLYMTWKGKKVGLSIISFNGKVKFKGSKRRGYIVRYSDLEIKNLVSEESSRNRPKPADDF